MRTIEDPKGNKLKLILMQVVDSDDRGPVMLRVRHDDEQIGLTDPKQRQFYMVWVPQDNDLATLGEKAFWENYEELKQICDQVGRELAEIKLEFDTLKGSYRQLIDEESQKTAELRKLQRERDPERFNNAVKVAVEAQTASYLGDKMRLQAENAELVRQLNELKESKKKLKEANERLKEQLKK